MEDNDGRIAKILTGIEKIHGVIGIVVYQNETGAVVTTTLDDVVRAQRYAVLACSLCKTAQTGLCEAVSEREFLRLLRLRTSHHELVIYPGSEYSLIAVQDPQRALE